MKKIACIFVASLVFVGCNYREQKRQIGELSIKDSLLLQQAQQKDSSIIAYVHSLNEIEDNLSAIKAREKIISMKGEAGSVSQSASIVADIKSLNELILKNHKEIASLESSMKSTNRQDEELKKMTANLSKEVTDKEVEIAELEDKISKAGDSIKLVVNQFNDTMVVVNRQKSEMGAMKTQLNTVYYAIGTYKELKQKGVLIKEGGAIGIGRVAALKKDFNTSYFTSAMIPDLQSIPLYGKFSSMVTNHPASSYKVADNGKTDALVITDPALFWSTGKYLVIIVTPPKREEVSFVAPPVE